MEGWGRTEWEVGEWKEVMYLLGIAWGVSRFATLALRAREMRLETVYLF